MEHSILNTWSEIYRHPGGWFRFRVMDCELIEHPAFEPIIRWTMESEAKDPITGENILMYWFSGAALEATHSCRLTNLFFACGVIDSAEDVDAMGDAGYSLVLPIGLVFEGLVGHPALRSPGRISTIARCLAPSTITHRREALEAEVEAVYRPACDPQE